MRSLRSYFMWKRINKCCPTFFLKKNIFLKIYLTWKSIASLNEEKAFFILSASLPLPSLAWRPISLETSESVIATKKLFSDRICHVYITISHAKTWRSRRHLKIDFSILYVTEFILFFFLTYFSFPIIYLPATLMNSIIISLVVSLFSFEYMAPEVLRRKQFITLDGYIGVIKHSRMYSFW